MTDLPTQDHAVTGTLEADRSHTPRPRGDSRGEAARRWVRKKQQTDPEFFRRTGAAGGNATLERHGREHFAALGRKGGAETLARRGADFMAEISQIAVEMRQSKQ